MTKRAESCESTPATAQPHPEIPPAVANNLVRLRVERGLALDELAARSGLSRQVLLALEAGREEPTIKTLWSLANALGVPFSALIAQDHPSSPPPAVRAARKASSAKDRVHSSEVYEIKLAGHASERALPRVPGALENALVISGHVEIQVGGALHRLASGDSASFPADIERRYFNPRAETATLSLAISEPVE